MLIVRCTTIRLMISGRATFMARAKTHNRLDKLMKPDSVGQLAIEQDDSQSERVHYQRIRSPKPLQMSAPGAAAHRAHQVETVSSRPSRRSPTPSNPSIVLRVDDTRVAALQVLV